MIRTKYKILEERSFYVYGLYRPDREEQLFYVGKGQGFRINNHRKEAKLLLRNHKKRILKERIIHYLWRLGLDFEEKFLYTNLSEKDAFKIEKYLIQEYGRIDLKTGCLANLTEGGDGPAGRIPWNKDVPRTENVKQKLIIANTGKRYTKEVNLSKGRKGRVSNRKGTVMSKEQKRKISLSGKKFYQTERGREWKKELSKKEVTEETRLKISIAGKGRKLNLTDKQRQNKSERMLGNTYGVGRICSEETKRKIKACNLGRKMSLESRAKMSKAKQGCTPWNKGKVAC